MFRSPSTPSNSQSSLNRLRFLPIDVLSVNSVPGARPYRVGALESKLPLSLGRSTRRGKQPSPFEIRTSAKCAYKPFRIRSFKTQHLKSFRIRIYEKTRRGGPPRLRNDAIAGTIRVLDPVILTSKEGARCDD